jgi:hypothetical protein
MKKNKSWLILITAMIISFTLTACGGKTQNNKSDASSANQIKKTVTVNLSSNRATNSSSVQEQQKKTTSKTNINTSHQKGEEKMITLTVNGTTLRAELTDNSSAEALKEMLANGPLTVKMSDYASMEKVGSLGRNLPTNDEQITTEAGDLILYQGNQLVIYYAPNSWNFTRLGKIKNVTASELKKILGTGNVEVTLAMAE